MSKSLPALVPDQALAAPGEAEASAIRKDYQVSMQGLRAYVSMGLRLIDVKARLPHGKYLTWCEKFIPELSARHINRAKYIAEGLIESVGFKSDTRVLFENLPPEIIEIIENSNGVRALLSTVQEYRDDQAEKDAEFRCRRFFLDDAELRDEWEPRVLSGELTWCQAIRGIAGQEATKGKKRSDPDYSILVQTSFNTICNSFKRWDQIKPEVREEIIVNARRLAAEWPAEVRAAIAAAR